jgi:predicted tellurium resistance membrane protein TerC
LGIRLTTDIIATYSARLRGNMIVFSATCSLVQEHRVCKTWKVRRADPGGKTYGAGIIVQIASIDIIFSLDGDYAVELVDNVPVMVAAIIISVSVMMLFSTGTIGDFIDKPRA